MLDSTQTLTDEEIVKLLAFFDRPALSVTKNNQRIRDQLIVLLMLDAGLRIGEVTRLPISSLWFQNEPVQAITLEHGIAEKGCTRTIPVTTRLRAAIEAMAYATWEVYKYQPQSKAFICYGTDSTLTHRQIQRMIKTAGECTIGRNIHPHMLRHTFATRLMRSCSTPIVQQLLGHKSLQSTQVYVHPNSSDRQKAIASIE
jgi:site-specific recombinase XerD